MKIVDKASEDTSMLAYIPCGAVFSRPRLPRKYYIRTSRTRRAAPNSPQFIVCVNLSTGIERQFGSSLQVTHHPNAILHINSETK